MCKKYIYISYRTMAPPTSNLKVFFAVLALGALLTLTKGKPQQRLQTHHKIKRESSSVDDYQGDYFSSDDPDYNDEDYKSDDGYTEEEGVWKIDPKIISKGDTFVVDKGTTIRLPCYVDKFPEKSYSIMWRKVDGGQDPNTYLVIDTVVMVERMSVEVVHDEEIDSKISDESGRSHRGSTLIIPLAQGEDQGQYVCIVAAHPNKEIKHTVQIRDPPTITKSPANGLMKVHKGDSVVMSCIGEGRPKPRISWRRLNKKMPDGRMEIEAEEIKFSSVTRHHSGTYECIGDNGYGQPARQTIEVEVEYSPEVEAEEIFIHASAGKKVELVCNVHAHPTAIVKWYKNTFELSDETAQLKKHGHRHTLNLPSIGESDMGNYTCRAENRLGTEQRILEVSGKAGFANFNSAPKGTEPNSFLLQWTSESHSDITSFELRWREHGEGSWRSVEVTPARENSFEWSGKHYIPELNVASRYEATVAAQNEEDWSRHSPVYHFATFGAEPLTDPNSSTSIQPFLSTVASKRSQILLSVLIALFTSRWHNRL